MFAMRHYEGNHHDLVLKIKSKPHLRPTYKGLLLQLLLSEFVPVLKGIYLFLNLTLNLTVT